MVRSSRLAAPPAPIKDRPAPSCKSAVRRPCRSRQTTPELCWRTVPDLCIEQAITFGAIPQIWPHLRRELAPQLAFIDTIRSALPEDGILAEDLTQIELRIGIPWGAVAALARPVKPPSDAGNN
jgi:hypothetical protein